MKSKHPTNFGKIPDTDEEDYSEPHRETDDPDPAEQQDTLEARQLHLSISVNHI